MKVTYTPEFKKKIVRLRLEEGRTINSITTEYGISKESDRQSQPPKGICEFGESAEGQEGEVTESITKGN